MSHRNRLHLGNGADACRRRDQSPLTLRDVIDRHGGEIWFQREKAAHRAFFRFVLPVATPAIERGAGGSRRASESRPEYYDFDLFNASKTTSVDLDRKLSELTYTVFDTETTGLEPSAGDEIIQIGATRIVNGRLLRQEVFDQLVDPRARHSEPESIPIHGITEDMVRGQPNIDPVLPAFHAFCADTVLVAHNAAFDMRFLQLKESGPASASPTGARYPAAVGGGPPESGVAQARRHPGPSGHRDRSRHNALEDALATAEVFLRMVPLLEEMDIVTVRQALEASEKTYFARVKY